MSKDEVMAGWVNPVTRGLGTEKSGHGDIHRAMTASCFSGGGARALRGLPATPGGKGDGMEQILPFVILTEQARPCHSHRANTLVSALQPPEQGENPFLSFKATQSAVLYYSSPRGLTPRLQGFSGHFPQSEERNR